MEFRRSFCPLFLFCFLSFSPTVTISVAGNFVENIVITGGNPTVREGGNVVDLRLDHFSASGFQSKQEFLFAHIDMQIKLPAGDSAGTVTSFYMSSQGSNHDEIDLEFLGNVTGEPYVLHTNVYTQGQGQREMQFYLWFDPTAAFHTYSILWNPYYILFYVDKMPIRLFSNEEAIGVPYPKNQAMMVYGSIWNADDWATQGGRVKTNWNSAPFVASYSNFKATPCPSTSTSSLCFSSPNSVSTSPHSRQSHDLMRQVDEGTRKTMNLLQKKYMIYNYCTDTRRFPEGLPRECPTENVKFK